MNQARAGIKMRILSTCAFLLVSMSAPAQDKVYSGPQPGEKTTGFKVLDVTGANAGKEVDYVAIHTGAPTVTVFFHGIERSLLPLANVVEQYAWERKDKLKAHFVFLGSDRLALEQRLPLVRQSVRWRALMTISVDGAEGPGNYGLNKQCLLTILVSKDDRVTANFALVQPGIADAPKVIAAMAAVCGDTAPPTAEQLQGRKQAEAGGRERPVRPGAMGEVRLDPSRFDLTTNEGLRAAVQALLAEVVSLRRELAAVRSGQAPPARNTGERPAGPLPGAAPTDQRLLSMLRSFIQPTNDNATVDRVMREVEDYVKGNADLTKQAIDGWVRVLHLKYGTEYARQVGQTMVDRLRK